MEVKQSAKDKLHFEDLNGKIYFFFSFRFIIINGKCKVFGRYICGIENYGRMFSERILLMNTHAHYAISQCNKHGQLQDRSTISYFKVHNLPTNVSVKYRYIAFGGQLYLFVELFS